MAVYPKGQKIRFPLFQKSNAINIQAKATPVINLRYKQKKDLPKGRSLMYRKSPDYCFTNFTVSFDTPLFTVRK
jgi:hypothetical protein